MIEENLKKIPQLRDISGKINQAIFSSPLEVPLDIKLNNCILPMKETHSSLLLKMITGITNSLSVEEKDYPELFKVWKDKLSIDDSEDPYEKAILTIKDPIDKTIDVKEFAHKLDDKK